MDHSEHCRSRIEAILSTTTEGHERLERARDRSALAAKEREDEEPQRKRHRPEGEGGGEGQPLAPPASGVRGNYQEGGHYRLRQRHRHLNHRHLQNGVWNRRPK